MILRRSAGQAATPLLRRLTAETLNPSSDAGGVCSCPLHGHLTVSAADDDLPPPPPPPSEIHAATSPRFSSFRPRVEHIYEVPKFADGVSGDLEFEDDDAAAVNGAASSMLYSELDTTTFGTVGRRTPSARATTAAAAANSRRQPYSSLHC